MAAPPVTPVNESQRNDKPLSVIRRIVKKIKQDVSSQKFPLMHHAKNTADRYTGLQTSTIKHLENLEELSVDIKEVDRGAIYRKLMFYYFDRNMMPTTYQLFVALEEDLPIYMSISKFRKVLVKMGFMWKYMSNNSFVVIEKPSIITERVTYLRNITRYRKKKLPIYYIEKTSFQCRSNSDEQKKFIYAVSENGVEFNKEVDCINFDSCLKWVQETLVRSLTSPSVIVLSNSKHHLEEVVKLPNPDSSRKEMTDWLDYFDVPHDPEMPKVILYDLVLKYTNVSKKILKIDAVLEAHGHTVLRIPDCICKVNPAALVYQTLDKNICSLVDGNEEVSINDVMTKFLEIVASIDSKCVRSFTELVAKEEINILEMDMFYDHLKDSLQENMASREIGVDNIDSDIPSSDSE